MQGRGEESEEDSTKSEWDSFHDVWDRVCGRG
jgi:hypothetical protein